LRYGELTRALARRGHHVTWWACDFSHQTRSFIGAPNARVESDGVSIVLVHGTGYRRNVGLRRLRHVAVHARSLARLVEHEQPPQVIVSAMPTTDACMVVTEFAGRNGIPVIIDVRDEWPEDYIRWLPRLARPLGRLALMPKFGELSRVCRAATSLTSVTERQLMYGLKHAGRDRAANDAVFYTGARRTPIDSELVSTQVAQWRARGLRDTDFICVFTGTMSPSRPLGPLITATTRLAGRMPLKLVLAGQGDYEAQYRGQANGSPAVIFTGWVDAVQMAALHEIANVLLAPYSPDYGFSMPTKIFDYLAAGRPMLSSCPGEAEELVRREGVGLQVRVDDVPGIEDALTQLHKDPEGCRRMGKRARVLFERQFALEGILERYADHIERIAAQREGRVS
jgi:glycosyltransferase involved in cell wall biosynthesis